MPILVRQCNFLMQLLSPKPNVAKVVPVVRNNKRLPNVEQIAIMALSFQLWLGIHAIWRWPLTILQPPLPPLPNLRNSRKWRMEHIGSSIETSIWSTSRYKTFMNTRTVQNKLHRQQHCVVTLWNAEEFGKVLDKAWLINTYKIQRCDRNWIQWIAEKIREGFKLRMACVKISWCCGRKCRDDWQLTVTWPRIKSTSSAPHFSTISVLTLVTDWRGLGERTGWKEENDGSSGRG